MAKKKTPITVTISKGKHKTQPYTFDIDDPGPGPKITVWERYTRASDARRGALRKLGTWEVILYQGKTTYHARGREVVFVTKPKRSK